MDFEDRYDDDDPIEGQSSVNSNQKLLQASSVKKYPGHATSLSVSNANKNSKEQNCSENNVVWDTEGAATLEQLKERVCHRRRVMDGTSNPHIHGIEIFPEAYQEFAHIYNTTQLHTLEKEFLLSDFDEDEKLSRTEIKYWMEKHGNPISERQLKKFLSSFDIDKDGKLSFYEFLCLCQHLGYQNTNRNCIENNEALDILTDSNDHPVFVKELKIDCTLELEESEIKVCKDKGRNENIVSVQECPRQKTLELSATTVQCKMLKGKGRVKEAVKFFEYRIAEASKELEKNTCQEEEMKEKKKLNSKKKWKTIQKNLIAKRIGKVWASKHVMESNSKSVKSKQAWTRSSGKFSNNSHSSEESRMNITSQKGEKPNLNDQIPLPPPMPPLAIPQYKSTDMSRAKVNANYSTGLNHTVTMPSPDDSVLSSPSEPDEFDVMQASAESKTKSSDSSRLNRNVIISNDDEQLIEDVQNNGSTL